MSGSGPSNIAPTGGASATISGLNFNSIDLTATVTIPDSTRAYNVYLYDDFAKVPVSNFNASAANAVQSWTIPPGSGATWSKTITTMSDQTRVFRAVPISAP